MDKIPSAPAVGTRVFAYGSGTRSTINVYGRGTYTGVTARADGSMDHRIELDDGNVVWGSEVNWVHVVWERTALGDRRPVPITLSKLISA